MKNKITKQRVISLIIKLIVASLIILVDLLTKSFFQNYFSSTSADSMPVIKGVLSFVFVKNTGAAFGVFQNNAIILAVFSVIFLLAFLIFDLFCGKKNAWYFIGVSSIIGGAIGNMVDRLIFGYVRDFIYLDFIGWFPVFNIADVFLTIGVICFMVYILFYMFKNDDKKETIKDVNNNSNSDVNCNNQITVEDNKENKESINSKDKK